MATTLSRSLCYLRRQGYVADVCERWLPYTRLRRDLFGCIDVLAVKPGRPILGVQSTTLSSTFPASSILAV